MRRRLVLAFVLAFLAGSALDLDELGQVLLRLLDVDERVARVAEDAEVAVDTHVDARRLEKALVVGVDFDPAWMGDKRSVVFRTSRGHYAPDVQGTGTEGIWVVDTATLKERQLYPPNDSTFGGLFPDPGPGDLVALSTLDAEEHELIVLVDGRSGRIVRRLDVGRSGECSEWSPDGRKIAYCHLQGSTFDVWVMNEDGSHQTRLTDDPGHDYPGQWSADGGQLTYRRLRTIISYWATFILSPSSFASHGQTRPPQKAPQRARRHQRRRIGPDLVAPV